MSLARDFLNDLAGMERESAAGLRDYLEGNSDVVPTDEEFRQFMISGMQVITKHLTLALRELDRQNDA
jgi:hypothetical protein